MLEVLKYVLSSFWTFAGTSILVYIIGLSVAMVVSAITGNGRNYALFNFSRKEGEIDSDTAKEGKNNSDPL